MRRVLETSFACATSLKRLGLLPNPTDAEAADLSLVGHLCFFTERIVPAWKLGEGTGRLCMSRQFAPAAGLADAPQCSDVGGLPASVLLIPPAEETCSNVVRCWSNGRRALHGQRGCSSQST